jgi:integrase
MNTIIYTKKLELNKTLTFLEAVEYYYQFQKNKVSIGTFKGYLQRVNHLKKYLVNFENALPSDINQIWADNYRQHLRKLNLGTNCINKHIKFVKQVLKHTAIQFPSLRFDLHQIGNKRDTETKPRPLTKADLQKISNVKLPAFLEAPRDYFLFLAETGFHFSDGLTVKKANISQYGTNYIIEKSRIKTNIEAILPASKLAIELLEKYNYSFKVKSNAEFNKNLKVIAILAGVRDDLRSSDARDTFADHWGNEKAIGLDDVSIMMGLTTTRELKKYLQVRKQRIIKMLENNNN